MDRCMILVVDDDMNLRRSLTDILKAKGYCAIAAKDGREGLALFNEYSANLVLIDLKLPDISGIEVLNRVKSASPSTQAIILTGSATLDSAIEATNKGAFSYLQKPYEIEQLLLNIRRAVEKQQAEEKIVRDSLELRRLNSELKALYDEAKSRSLHDPLTGLGNRRYMIMQMDKSLEVSKRYGARLSVIMADIDHFKKYNDTRGHVEGDKLLGRIADILREECRSADHVFRYGGEEFLVMLPETDLSSACVAAERLRRAVEERGEITISLGVSSYRETMRGSEDLITRADEALYTAKKNGRNRVAASG